MIKGRDLILYINDEPIACARNGQITIDTSFINVCSPVSGSAEEVLPTTVKWSASSDSLISDPQYVDMLTEIALTKQSCVLRFSLDGAGNRKGTCYISHIEQTGTVRNLAKCNIRLQGSSQLERYGIPYEFTPFEDDLSIGSGASIQADQDDRIDCVEITSKYPFKLTFEGSPYWFVIPGSAEEWKQDIEDLDGHGEILRKNVANGVGGSSDVITAGKYAIFASNYESKIKMKLFV